jgi:hypothetical protein
MSLYLVRVLLGDGGVGLHECEDCVEDVGVNDANLWEIYGCCVANDSHDVCDVLSNFRGWGY